MRIVYFHSSMESFSKETRPLVVLKGGESAAVPTPFGTEESLVVRTVTDFIQIIKIGILPFFVTYSLPILAAFLVFYFIRSNNVLNRVIRLHKKYGKAGYHEIEILKNNPPGRQEFILKNQNDQIKVSVNRFGKVTEHERSMLK